MVVAVKSLNRKGNYNSCVSKPEAVIAVGQPVVVFGVGMPVVELLSEPCTAVLESFHFPLLTSLLTIVSQKICQTTYLIFLTIFNC